MKRINLHGRSREYVYVAAFLLFFVIMLVILSALPQAEIIRISGTQGNCDLTGSSFDDTNYLIAKESWESWPEKLYTPDKLNDKNIAGQSRLLDAGDYSVIQYATHRLRLNLPPGKTYGVKFTSSDYSMVFHVNGVKLDSVGVPGETRETTVPRVKSRVFYFISKDGEAELVVQAANFVHAADGAWPPDFCIGTQDNITRQNNVANALSFLLALMDKNLLRLFFPEYNWFIAIRLEYIIHFLTFAVLTRFLEMLYPDCFIK